MTSAAAIAGRTARTLDPSAADCRRAHHPRAVWYDHLPFFYSDFLLWNIWGQVDAARRLIASPGPLRPEDLKGRLSDGY